MLLIHFCDIKFIGLSSGREWKHTYLPQINGYLLRMKGEICTTSLKIPLLKSTSWICNISFLLLGYRHVISVSACLVLLYWNPVINPLLFLFQGQGIFFLLKPICGFWRSQSLESSHGFLLLPRIWIYLFCLPFSQQEHKHRYNPEETHKLSSLPFIIDKLSVKFSSVRLVLTLHTEF